MILIPSQQGGFEASMGIGVSLDFYGLIAQNHCMSYISLTRLIFDAC